MDYRLTMQAGAVVYRNGREDIEKRERPEACASGRSRLIALVLLLRATKQAAIDQRRDEEVNQRLCPQREVLGQDIGELCAHTADRDEGLYPRRRRDQVAQRT